VQRARTRYLQEPMQFDFTKDMIRLEGPNFSEEVSWKLVRRVYETNRAFFIYHSGHKAWTLPKHFFAGDADVSHWRQLAAQYLPKGSSVRRPRLIGRWL